MSAGATTRRNRDHRGVIRSGFGTCVVGSSAARPDVEAGMVVEFSSEERNGSLFEPGDLPHFREDARIVPSERDGRATERRIAYDLGDGPICHWALLPTGAVADLLLTPAETVEKDTPLTVGRSGTLRPATPDEFVFCESLVAREAPSDRPVSVEVRIRDRPDENA